MSIGFAPDDDRWRSAIAKRRIGGIVAAGRRGPVYDAGSHRRRSSLMTRRPVSALIFAATVAFSLASLRAADQPKGELHRGVEYPGAAAFFSLGQITVVYPAGPGEPVELNRRSAEARARWLASVHKNKTTVVADNELTPEQKKGNLLILGWNNRAFGSPSPMRPFTHGASGTRFFGIVEPDPKVDVLVFHRNPLNWESCVLFWTRIDPERDRYQVVPRLGSDWGMYRDYRVVRQGMFVPARVWPPARDVVAEADHTTELSMRPGGTGTFDSDHYHVTFDRQDFKDPELRAIVDVREAAFTKAVAAMGPAPKGFRIKLFVYDKDETKLASSSVGDPAHEVPAARELHMTKRVALIPSPRGEVHVLAREMYGPCYLTSIYEGLALAYENQLDGMEMDLAAATLRSAGRLPDLATLLDEESFRASVGQTGPAGAGVFMAWVRQTYGVPGVKKAYGFPGGTPAAFAGALGTTESALKSSFASWADAKAAARKKDLDFLAAEREAQDKRMSSDWPGMVAALKKALAAKPGDPQTLFNLASAQMRAD